MQVKQKYWPFMLIFQVNKGDLMANHGAVKIREPACKPGSVRRPENRMA
jgi:hypothetical protein